MSDSQLINSEYSFHLLVLGCGEIARTLVSFAQHLDCHISVCDEQAKIYSWPECVEIIEEHFNTKPFPLTTATHAIIARGHIEDVQSVTNLLNFNASHVYLIASAARSQSVIDKATPLLNNPQVLSKLSAPAGIDLGGNNTAEICLSILAEIQWRCHHNKKSLRPLSELREQRISTSISGQRNKSCPGKRN